MAPPTARSRSTPNQSKVRDPLKSPFGSHCRTRLITCPRRLCRKWIFIYTLKCCCPFVFIKTHLPSVFVLPLGAPPPPQLCPAHSHILPLSLPDLEWLWNQDASRDLLLAVHPPNYIVLWNGDTGTKLWKKSYAENILSFSFDPFDSSNMACGC